MKKFKKIFLAVVCLLLMPVIAECQAYQKGTFSVSLGGEVLFAESKLTKSHRMGPGATLKGEYVFSKHATVTILSGYYFMKSKNKTLLNNENISAIPVKTGIRYYFGNFYGAGEAGGIFFSGFNQGRGFAYSLGMGDKIKLNDRVIDISLRHEAWVLGGNTNAIIALRLGYEFSVNQKINKHRGL